MPIRISLHKKEVRFILACLQDEYRINSKRLEDAIDQTTSDFYKSIVENVKRLIYKIGKQLNLK